MPCPLLRRLRGEAIGRRSPSRRPIHQHSGKKDKMRAIAFGIVLAALFLIPYAEFEHVSESTKGFTAGFWLFCLCGFIYCVLTGK